MPPKKETAAVTEEDKERVDWSKVTPRTIGDKIIVDHSSGQLYDSKIVAVKHSDSGEPIYVVHYQGWNSRFDESFPHSQAQDQFLEYTPENVEKAKQQQQLTASSKKKSVKRRTDDLLDTSSRASTPKDASRDASVASDAQIGGRTPAPSRKRRGGAEERPGGGSPSPVPKGASTEPATKRDVRKALVPTFAPVPDIGARSPNVIEKFLLNLTFPEPLKKILIEDEHAIKDHKLTRIPARITVSEIIDEYAKSTGGNRERDEVYVEYDEGAQSHISQTTNLVESIVGLQDYFNVLVGTQLLYKFERKQYLDEVEKARKAKEELEAPVTKKRKKDEDEGEPKTQSHLEISKMLCASKLYGLPHLLRMMVRFGTIIACTNWSDRATELVIKNVSDFMVFLSKNHAKYFNLAEDYQAAGSEYMRGAYQ